MGGNGNYKMMDAVTPWSDER